jgi:hypothetical protein
MIAVKSILKFLLYDLDQNRKEGLQEFGSTKEIGDLKKELNRELNSVWNTTVKVFSP